MPASVQARLASPPAPILPGRPATGALQPALRFAQPPKPIVPTQGQPSSLQPATPSCAQSAQAILLQQAKLNAGQPHAGGAFPLPGNFTLKPRGSGQPLPEPIQKKMESFFETSFADVRVHVGQEAPSIGALAFTHGSDLYFAPGQYNPQSSQGQQLLGHELTHVLQQRAGRVRNPLGSGVAVVQDPALEAEAERMGMRAASASVPVQAKLPGAALAGTMSSQPVRPVPVWPKAGSRSCPVLVHVSTPARSRENSVCMKAEAGRQPLGSPMVHSGDDSAIDVIGLRVTLPQAREGLGGILLASAVSGPASQSARLASCGSIQPMEQKAQYWHCTTCGEELDYGHDWRYSGTRPTWNCENGHDQWLTGKAPKGTVPQTIETKDPEPASKNATSVSNVNQKEKSKKTSTQIGKGSPNKQANTAVSPQASSSEIKGNKSARSLKSNGIIS